MSRDARKRRATSPSSSTLVVALVVAVVSVLVALACSATPSSLLVSARPHDRAPPTAIEERHAARRRDRDEVRAASAVGEAPAAPSPAPTLRDLAAVPASAPASAAADKAGSGKVKAASASPTPKKNDGNKPSSFSSTPQQPPKGMKCAPDASKDDKLADSPLGYAASQLANAPCARAASGIPDPAAAAAATPRKEPRGGVAGDVATAGLSKSVAPQSLDEVDRYFEDDDGSIAHPVAPVGEAIGGGGGKVASGSSSTTPSSSSSSPPPRQQQQQQQQGPPRRHPPHRGRRGNANDNESGGEQSALDETLAGALGNNGLPRSASGASSPRALPSQRPSGSALGDLSNVAAAAGQRRGPSGDPLGDLSNVLEEASKLEQEVASSPLGEALPKLVEAAPQAAQTIQAAGQALTPIANDVVVGMANLPSILPPLPALLGRRRLAQTASAPAPAPAAATPLASSPLASLAARIGEALGLLPPPAPQDGQPKAQQAATLFPL